MPIEARRRLGQKSSLEMQELSIHLGNNSIYNEGTIQTRTNILLNDNTTSADSPLGPGRRGSRSSPTSAYRTGPVTHRVPGSEERSGLSHLERVRGIQEGVRASGGRW